MISPVFGPLAVYLNPVTFYCTHAPGYLQLTAFVSSAILFLLFAYINSSKEFTEKSLALSDGLINEICAQEDVHEAEKTEIVRLLHDLQVDVKLIQGRQEEMKAQANMFLQARAVN